MLLKRLQQLLWRPKTADVVAEYEDSLRSRRLKDTTVGWHVQLLERLAAASPLLPDRIEELERFIGRMDIVVETHRDYVRILRQFYDWCVARGKTQVNLGVSLPMPPPEETPFRVYSQEECWDIYRACRTDQDRLMVKLVYDAGFRVEELWSITTRSVVPGAVWVKGKRGRRLVDVDPGLIDEIMVVAEGEYLWTSQQKGPRAGRRLTTSGLQQRWRALNERAGLVGRKLGPHTGRHTHATYSIAEGTELAELQARLGHKKLSTTSIYVHRARFVQPRKRVSPLETLTPRESVA
ncbi:MAG: site-specific integrase [Actinomycetota bacterium]|nr:site-specific integrase [Actinomycetota bacterium]